MALVHSKGEVLVNQINWVISHKELEAATICTKLMQNVMKLL